MLQSKPSDMVLKQLREAYVAPLVLKFESGYVPFGFFARLLILFAEWCKRRGLKIPELYKDYARASLTESGTPYTVILVQGRSVISASVIRSDRFQKPDAKHGR